MSAEQASSFSSNVQISGVNRRGSQQEEISVSLSGNASWKVWHVEMEERKAGVERAEWRSHLRDGQAWLCTDGKWVAPLGRHLANLF